MDNFIFSKDKDKNIVYKYKYLSQTIEVKFMPYNTIDNNWWYMSAIIFNKRKNKEMLFENNKLTGEIGISGLIVIKNILLNFMNYLKTINKNNYIAIIASNSKRRRIYNIALSKYGFKNGKIDNIECLYKKI